jgi:hypothetical protein
MNADTSDLGWLFGIFCLSMGTVFFVGIVLHLIEMNKRNRK